MKLACTGYFQPLMATIFGGRPTVDPASLYRECADHLPPIPTDQWWGRANAFTIEPGRNPGRGWLLLRKSDLTALDLTVDHDLTFSGADRDHVLTLSKITLLRRTCVIPGAEADPAAVYLCEVVDRRHQLARKPFLPSHHGYRAYNVKDSEGEEYLEDTAGEDGVAWTWQEIIDDLAIILDEDPAQFALPATPDGDPENFIFHDCGPWEALNRVLDRLAFAAVYDPVADTFSVARLGESRGSVDDKDKNLDEYADRPRLWDGYESETAIGWRPETIQVRFIRRPQPTNGKSPYYVKEITLPDAAADGVVLGSSLTLDDDLTAIGATGTPENSSDLDDRAQERADDWLRKRQFYERPVLRVWRDFIPTGVSLAGYSVGRIMFDDRGGPFATAVKAEPDGLLENWKTLKPWENIPGGDDDDDTSGGCDWVDALTEEDCLLVSPESASGRCGCAETFTPFLLASVDGLTWSSDQTIRICGVNYTVSFSKEACNGPCFSLRSVTEGSYPCCDPEDEGTSLTVPASLKYLDVLYSGDLTYDEETRAWVGELTAAEAGDCFQVDGGAILTRTTPGVDSWSDGVVTLNKSGATWTFIDIGTCPEGDQWTATGWDGTGCQTFTSGTCTPTTVEICAVACP